MEKDILLTHGDLKIHCVCSEPEDGDIRRIVLGVHGLGGCARDEIQSAIAEEMDMYYSATVRFDFPGQGESPMSDEYLTLHHCKESLQAVGAYIRETYPDVEDLCIFATGFGAYVTLVALQDLQELPGKLKLVVQTPSVRMHDTFLKMRDISRPTLEAMGVVECKSRRRNFHVTYDFYREMEENIALTTYPLPMLILHSDADEYIRMEDIQQFHRINEGSQLVIIPGISHRFHEDGAWDMVLDLTRDWFEFEQVLLM
jgi:alpha-beta hydrolase superfamily lysophospholipase